ncbi:aminotransferase class V-fold PLP-dependent enzyme [Tepidibacter formicigenes]|uniref:Selenocysteine lyase/Cysteine desulfurase n=1 Tax=Tepidibacter formicigenes DSM 15518 TaxID=1123349 RepID=A0A1M6RD63_9FIRM|nr:aminotransferase class V-fold PLP-dependent enzyme [Tepidibacter formicigenes]SHK30401.1 Selenocysteine lyase/Cysteine desulfurase [Tepidibacter formicigenes DSM 15518]
MKFDKYKKLVVGVNSKVPLTNGKLVKYINFDNAATTPPFISVLNEILNFSTWYSSIHRGKGYKSQLSSEIYDKSRKIVADFVKADLKYNTVIYVKNATEAINMLCNILSQKYGEFTVLSTCMEHHSNDLPWRKKCKIDYVNIDSLGRLDLNDLKNKLIQHSNSVKLVTVTGLSNVTGYKNPIHKIASLAHKYGSEILVDGAQLIPHAAMDMKAQNHEDHIDYLVFSAHKMYAPFGTGVLIGPKSTFEKKDPDYVGGGTVDIVTHDFVKWTHPPEKYEAGTPNVMGVVALIKAIKTLNKLGMNNLEIHERNLTNYTIENLKLIPDIKLYGDCENYKDKSSIISFNIEGISHELVAKILSCEGGIAVRNGCFCAQPYIQQLLNISKEEIEKRIIDSNLPHPGMVRISFGLYNDYKEIDILIKMLNKIVKNKEYYIEKYKSI